ncbi:glycosyltransferase [Candidatus Mycoplasma pogonae]
MKLTVILSAQKQTKKLAKFLESMRNQESKHFEIILYINHPSKNDYDLITHYKEFFAEKLKVFFNILSSEGNQNWLDAAEHVSGDYVVIAYPEIILKPFFVKSFLHYAEKYPVDLIETRPRFKGFFKWTPRARVQPEKIIDLANNKEIVAFSFPFIFNKFIKSEVFESLAASKNRLALTSTKNWIELVYEIFIYTKTYCYINDVLINDWNEGLSSFNSSSFIKQWRNIQANNLLSEKFLDEIQYAKMYFFEIFLSAMIGSAKKSHLKNLLNFENSFKKHSQKLNSHIEKLRKEEFFEIEKTNKYFYNLTTENQFLSKFLPPAKWHKITDLF